MKIQVAGREDLLSLSYLGIALWPDNDRLELLVEFENWIEDEEARVFVAREKDGSVVAFAHCQIRHDYVEGSESSPVAYLEGIYVENGRRRQGVASDLVTACQEWAREAGVSELGSDCELDNIDSFKFHLACGFIEANRTISFIKKVEE